MIAKPRASKIPRRTSPVAANTNIMPLRQADPATNASRRSSHACRTSDNLRNKSMPRDQAAATVNSAPKRIGITRITAVVRSLLESHAQQDHSELDAIARCDVKLVHRHPDGGQALRRTSR